MTERPPSTRRPALMLPDGTGGLAPFTPMYRPVAPPAAPHRWVRRALAAAHVVADPLVDADPASGGAIDRDATLAFRRHLLDLGFGIAEAMDTAQRGMGLDWPAARSLIGDTLAEAGPERRDRIWCGVGTDHLPDAPAEPHSIATAWIEQMHAVQHMGGRVIVMASRALSRSARTPRDYATTYARVLAEADQPVILHWLGDMFDPALTGYWGSRDLDEAADLVAELIATHAARIDGIKMSLLDAGREVALRRRLPPGVRMYTGDDFHYPELIAGDGEGHSDALLGILDPIAPVAAAALAAQAAGDMAGYHAALAPTVPLARRMFCAPTRFYKTGVVFLAWLNGHQRHFTMLGGAHSMRSLPHLADLFRLADAAGLLADPDLACNRMRRLLALHGVAT